MSVIRPVIWSLLSLRKLCFFFVKKMSLLKLLDTFDRFEGSNFLKPFSEFFNVLKHKLMLKS